MHETDQAVGGPDQFSDPEAVAAGVPDLDRLLLAWDALDIPDPEAARALAADESVPDIVRRAQILARISPWLVLYQTTCQSLGSMTFAEAAELAQDADQEAIGDMGDGYEESALALNLQIERLRWAHSNLVASKGPTWNPPADLVLGSLEGVIRVIEAWRVVYQHAGQRGDELADGTPAGALDPELLRQGYHRIVGAVDQFGEATLRAQAGETAD
ncbi:hypothetical protein [Amycolatopsis sp. NPDC004079]|uniref:hypothetical protein n=1 Tax=Amycolatopsis sp. NPDC004079 TaxID=3154549 RepID=UPI0033A78C69